MGTASACMYCMGMLINWNSLERCRQKTRNKVKLALALVTCAESIGCSFGKTCFTSARGNVKGQVKLLVTMVVMLATPLSMKGCGNLPYSSLGRG